MRSRLALAVLVLLEAAALAAAWWRIPVPAPIDWSDPLGWLHRTDPETATLVVGRLLAIVVAAWLLGSTLLAVAAAAAVRFPRHLRALLTLGAGAAPGTVRHLAQAAIAVSLVAATARSAVAAPAAPVPAPAQVRPVAAARPLLAPLAPVRDGRTPTTPPVPPVADAPPAPPAPTAPGAPGATILRLPVGDRHRVVAGESLWSIAEARVAESHAPRDPGEVDRYWRALCDANRERLVSGDVNAIQPGEDLDLPPVA